jgi:hypothetical protein
MSDTKLQCIHMYIWHETKSTMNELYTCNVWKSVDCNHDRLMYLYMARQYLTGLGPVQHCMGQAHSDFLKVPACPNFG